MRLLVCGGRDYNDRARVFRTLDYLHTQKGISCVISGAARGADTLAANWAISRGVPLEEYAAEWDKHGRRAGPIRNKRMLVEGKPDGGLAFDTGGPGTGNMINQMIEARLPHSVVNCR